MGQTVITHALEQTVICTHPLTLGRPNARLAESIMLERMRMSKRDFRRGLAYNERKRGYRSRTILPLV